MCRPEYVRQMNSMWWCWPVTVGSPGAACVINYSPTAEAAAATTTTTGAAATMTTTTTTTTTTTAMAMATAAAMRSEGGPAGTTLAVRGFL